MDATADDLRRVDFAPFAALADMPLAMTAHVVYSALDPSAPATLSARLIREAIRDTIGFEGLLISDDLCMRALSGTPAERAQAALEAGCDVVLHCNGDLAEMRTVAEACQALSANSRRRLARAQGMRGSPEPFERKSAAGRLAVLLGSAVSA